MIRIFSFYLRTDVLRPQKIVEISAAVYHGRVLMDSFNARQDGGDWIVGKPGINHYSEKETITSYREVLKRFSELFHKHACDFYLIADIRKSGIEKLFFTELQLMNLIGSPEIPKEIFNVSEMIINEHHSLKEEELKSEFADCLALVYFIDKGELLKGRFESSFLIPLTPAHKPFYVAIAAFELIDFKEPVYHSEEILECCV